MTKSTHGRRVSASICVTPPRRWIVIDLTLRPKRWAAMAWAISCATTDMPSSTANEAAMTHVHGGSSNNHRSATGANNQVMIAAPMNHEDESHSGTPKGAPSDTPDGRRSWVEKG